MPMRAGPDLNVRAPPLRLTEPRIFFGVPHPARDVVVSLWALDARLGAQIDATREVALAQIRLRWWQEQLAALAAQPTGGALAADPLLTALANDPSGAADMQLLADIWEDWLVRDPDNHDEAVKIAARRGSILFTVTSRRIAPTTDAPQGAGGCWGQVDMALNGSDPEQAHALFQAAAHSPPKPAHVPVLALLDRWAVRVARRRGVHAPARDAAWLFAQGLGLAVVPTPR